MYILIYIYIYIQAWVGTDSYIHIYTGVGGKCGGRYTGVVT